ncbi:MAG: helix-turn-helix domain-containing protein [Gaiellales bacterium]
MADDHPRLTKAAQEYRRAEDGLREARVAVRKEIVAAREEGATMRSIGDILGVSRQRVREILREEGAVGAPTSRDDRVA